MKNNKLIEKINLAESIILDAQKTYGNSLAVAWTGGKDSTVLLHIIRKCFNGKIPFPVMFNDSTMEFDEVYQFIDLIHNEWNFKLITIPHLREDLKKFYELPTFEEKKRLSRLMKINVINYALKKYKFSGFFAAVRRDEHSARSKEKYISERENHIRVHPVLHFTEKDIWAYIHMFSVPYVSLYDKGYRSLGEKPFTKPSTKHGGERSGREKDKEKLMHELRELGYW